MHFLALKILQYSNHPEHTVIQKAANGVHTMLVHGIPQRLMLLTRYALNYSALVDLEVHKSGNFTSVPDKILGNYRYFTGLFLTEEKPMYCQTIDG